MGRYERMLMQPFAVDSKNKVTEDEWLRIFPNGKRSPGHGCNNETLNDGQERRTASALKCHGPRSSDND